MAQNQRHSLAAQTQRPFDLATPSTADSYDARDEWNGDEPPSSSGEESDDDEEESLLNKPPNTPMLENGTASHRQQQQSDWHPTQWSKALKKNKEVKYLLYVLTGLVLLSGGIGIWAAGQYGVKNPVALSAGKQFITMDHLFNYTFWVEQKEVEWVKEAGDGIFSTLSPNNSIILVDLNSPSSGSSSSPGKESVLLNLQDVKHPKTGDVLDFTNNGNTKGGWRLSPDMKYVLVKVAVKKQWRYSSFATYYIYEIASKTTRALHPPPPTPKSRTRYATWSPTGHTIVYVHESDIYVIPDVKKLFTGNEDRIRLTSTPEEESKGNGIVFNGVPGWVYEEEIFNSPHTLYFSPGSTKLAFLSFNESEVPEYSFPVYNPTNDNSKVVEYTKENKMRYPKPGFPNPVVDAWIFDLDGYLNDPSHVSRSEYDTRQDRPTIEYTSSISHGVENHLYSLSWPGRFTPDESIIFETVWVSDDQLLVKESDRGADHGVVVLFQADNLPGSGGGRVEGKVVRKLGKDGDEANDGGWLETNRQGVHTIPSTLLTKLVAGSSSGPYLDIVPSPAGYNHIALFPSASSPTSEAYFLTMGEWEVVGTVGGIGQREDGGVYIYFLAARPHPGERRVFSVKIPSLGEISGKTGEDRLGGEPIFELTPTGSTSVFGEDDEAVGAAAAAAPEARVLVGEELKTTSSPAYYTVKFSPFSGFYQLNYEGPGIPWQKVLKVGGGDNTTSDDEFSYTLTNNSQLRQTLQGFELPKVEWWSLPTEDGKSTVSIKTIYPPNFGGGFSSNPGTPRNKQPSFPILFKLYNGPTSQMVDYRFTLHWDEYLASSPSHQYVVCIIDGRGTGFRGRPYRNVIKGRLGFWEEVDQRAGARGVINSLNKDRRIIDDKRVGVWGWSYGGYMSSKLVETNLGDAEHKHEAGPYNLAMAVAPVTDWRLYDSIYTERYLSTPQRNSLNYTLSSITNVTSFGYTSPSADSEQNDWVGRFGTAAQTGGGKGKSKSLSYLLAHGTGDDNVHFSNSAHLIDMLTGQGIRGWRFRMFVDSDHSIYKRNAQRELYEFLTSFLEEKWGRGGIPSRSRDSLIARG